MCALWAGQDHFRSAWRGGGRRHQAHPDALVSHELPTGAPVFSAAPIAPEHTPRADCHRLLAAAPGPEATALLDSAASHRKSCPEKHPLFHEVADVGGP
jgi:hypothetical protein